MYYSLRAIRTCIACRKKMSQKVLLRLVIHKGEIEAFKGAGRSFYLCKECLNNTQRIAKSLNRLKTLNQKQQSITTIEEIARQWVK